MSSCAFCMNNDFDEIMMYDKEWIVEKQVFRSLHFFFYCLVMDSRETSSSGKCKIHLNGNNVVTVPSLRS